jgi:hypothetical protein
VPAAIKKALEMAAPLIMLVFIILSIVYDDSYRFNKKFSIEISLVFVAVFLSMFGAYFFHGQGFTITFLTQRVMYMYLLYYLLHVLKPKPEDFISLFVTLGIIYAFVYIIQTVIYPKKIVDVRIFTERGTLRIFISGIGYAFLAYLVSVTKFIRTYNWKYFFIALLMLTVFILLGTRQLIGATGLITILIVLFSKKVKSRPLTIFIMALGAVPAYFLFKDIFIALIELSQKQAGSSEENIRVRAAMFFLFEFFPNKLSYIIGNGAASNNSAYGLRVTHYKEAFGFFQSDIGIIGEYTKYGILIVITQLIIYGRILFLRLPIHLEFLKFQIMVTVLTMFTGAGSFTTADNIVIICIILYMIDVHFDTLKFVKSADP